MKTLARLHRKTKEREKLCLNYIRFTQSYQLARGWLRVVNVPGWCLPFSSNPKLELLQQVCVCVRVEFQFVLEFKLQLDPCSWLPGAKFSFWFIKLVRVSKLFPHSRSPKGNLGNDRSRHNFSPIWIISFDCYSFDFLPKSVQTPDDTTGVVHFPPNWLHSEGVCRKQTPNSPENRTSTTRRARRTA